MKIIHDTTGDGISTAIMDMALSMKKIERYERQDGWPALVFDDGSVLKFVSNEIEGIAIYRHAHEDHGSNRLSS
jgi:hypothetical protein